MPIAAFIYCLLDVNINYQIVNIVSKNAAAVCVLKDVLYGTGSFK